MLLAFKEQLREENKLKYANRAARGQAGSAKKTFRGKNSKDSAALVHGIPPPLEEILWEDVSDTGVLDLRGLLLWVFNVVLCSQQTVLWTPKPERITSDRGAHDALRVALL